MAFMRPLLLLVLSLSFGQSFLLQPFPSRGKKGSGFSATCKAVMKWERAENGERSLDRRLAIETLSISAATFLAVGGANASSPPKKVLVTGANSGIGYAATELLASHGVEVVLGCQTAKKAFAARDKILSVVPGAKVIVLESPLELLDLSSVSSFAQELRSKGALSGLLLCAGVDGKQEGRTVDGLEEHISINHIGGFLLTAELRKSLSSDGRVITISSSAALDANPGAVMSDINWKKNKYDKRQAYCISKACCVLFADELSRRGLQACSVDPGPCATQIVRYELPQRAKQRQGMTPAQLARQARQLGLRTPIEGALLPAAFAEGLNGPAAEAFVSGSFYLGAAAPPGVQVPVWSPPLPWRTPETAKAVWEQSVALAQRAASPLADFS